MGGYPADDGALEGALNIVRVGSLDVCLENWNYDKRQQGDCNVSERPRYQSFNRRTASAVVGLMGFGCWVQLGSRLHGYMGTSLVIFVEQHGKRMIESIQHNSDTPFVLLPVIPSSYNSNNNLNNH